MVRSDLLWILMCWLTRFLGCDALNTTVSVSWRSVVSFFVRVEADLAWGHPRLLRAESRPVVVDLCFASCHACKLLFNHLGGVSHWSVMLAFHVPLAL